MLTEAAVGSAKPAPKPYKRYDERGMFLFVTPSGAQLWQLKYRIAGKDKLSTLSAYPDVSLKRAREKHDEARSLIADGVDPAAKKKAERQASADTFAAIAAEYIELRREHLNPRTLAKAQWILNDWLLKYLGSQWLNSIKPVDILSVCRRLESQGVATCAHVSSVQCVFVKRRQEFPLVDTRTPCLESSPVHRQTRRLQWHPRDTRQLRRLR